MFLLLSHRCNSWYNGTCTINCAGCVTANRCRKFRVGEVLFTRTRAFTIFYKNYKNVKKMLNHWHQELAKYFSNRPDLCTSRSTVNQFCGWYRWRFSHPFASLKLSLNVLMKNVVRIKKWDKSKSWSLINYLIHRKNWINKLLLVILLVQLLFNLLPFDCLPLVDDGSLNGTGTLLRWIVPSGPKVNPLLQNFPNYLGTALTFVPVDEQLTSSVAGTVRAIRFYRSCAKCSDERG